MQRSARGARARAMSAPVRPLSPRTMKKKLQEKMVRKTEEEQDRAMLRFQQEGGARAVTNRRKFEELTAQRLRTSGGERPGLPRTTSSQTPAARMRALTLDMDAVNAMREQEQKEEREQKGGHNAARRPVTARGILQQRQKEMLANKLAKANVMETEKEKLRKYQSELQERVRPSSPSAEQGHQEGE